MRSLKAKKLAIFILPGLLTVFYLLMKSATGPYWLGNNSDPAYIYLMNGLYLLDGATPVFTDHPGTPLQLLIAGVVGLMNGWQPMPDVLHRVFSAPERYLSVVSCLLWSFYILTACLLGLSLYRSTRCLRTVFLYQLPGLLYLTIPSFNAPVTVLPIVSNINSETLMIGFLNLFLLCLAKVVHRQEGPIRPQLSVVWGFVCGAALATKFTFFPLMIIPLALLPSIKRKFLFLTALCVSFFVFTIPILPQYPAMGKWLYGLIFRLELHGSGGKGLLNIRSFAMSLSYLMEKNSIILSIFVLGSFFGCRRILKKGEGNASPGALLLLSSVGLLQFIFVAKQGGLHYLTPAVCLTGPVLELLYRQLRRPMYKTVYACVLGAMCLFLLAQAVIYQRELRITNTSLEDFYNKNQREYSACHLIPHYRASSPWYALEFGDDCHIRNKYGKVLDEQFPHQYFYHYWKRNFQSFDKNLLMETLLKEKSCVMLYGSSLGGEEPYFHLEKVDQVYNEKLFRVISSTLDEAHISFLQSAVLQEQGRYQLALLLALRAKRYGRPGLERYIENLKKLSSESGKQVLFKKGTPP